MTFKANRGSNLLKTLKSIYQQAVNSPKTPSPYLILITSSLLVDASPVQSRFRCHAFHQLWLSLNWNHTKLAGCHMSTKHSLFRRQLHKFAPFRCSLIMGHAPTPIRSSVKRNSSSQAEHLTFSSHSMNSMERSHIRIFKPFHWLSLIRINFRSFARIGVREH